jgi:hypothetical protein
MIPQEEDLAEVKGQMFWEMDLLAELDDCSIEVEWLGVV